MVYLFCLIMAAPVDELQTMETIQLNYGGHNFNILVDKTEGAKILKDPEYAASYAQMLVNMGMKSQLGIPAEVVQEQVNPKTHSESEEISNIHVVSEKNLVDFRWDRATTLLLIDVRSSLSDKFDNGPIRKKKLWDKVSEEINKVSSSSVTGELCNAKWRNLLSRYRTIKDKLKDSGAANSNWEYFDLMDDALHTKVSSAPPRNRLLSSLKSQSEDSASSSTCELHLSSPTTEEESESQSRASCSSPDDAPPAKKMKKLRKGPPEWYTDLQAEEREREQQRQMEENRRWEEQKDIEKQKIEAFNKFSEILGKFMNKQ